jgi:hypothetical protein
MPVSPLPLSSALVYGSVLQNRLRPEGSLPTPFPSQIRDARLRAAIATGRP